MAIMASFTLIEAQSQIDDNNQLIKVYKQALELNKDRFVNPNLIYVGDTVLFPARNGYGIEVWLADEPSEGKHDSFWRLSEKYLKGQLLTIPADTIKIKIKETVDTPVSESKKFNWWLLLTVIVFGLGLLLAFLKSYSFRSAKDPDRYQAVGSNMDTTPREENLRAIMTRYLLPGERLINFRRGSLTNTLKQKGFQTNMEFGDHVNRNVWLKSGERVATAVIENQNGIRRTQHFRSACANGFGSNEFQLPNGWFIQYDEDEEAGRVFTETDENGAQSLKTTPSQTTNNLIDLAKIIESMNKAGNQIEISFQEKSGDIKLSIKIDKKKK